MDFLALLFWQALCRAPVSMRPAALSRQDVNKVIHINCGIAGETRITMVAANHPGTRPVGRTAHRPKGLHVLAWKHEPGVDGREEGICLAWNSLGCAHRHGIHEKFNRVKPAAELFPLQSASG